jgi:hypothetical protein
MPSDMPMPATAIEQLRAWLPDISAFPNRGDPAVEQAIETVQGDVGDQRQRRARVQVRLLEPLDRLADSARERSTTTL